MDHKKIAIQKLEQNIDEAYAKKVSVFVPTEATILGVRVPQVKKIAAEMSKDTPQTVEDLVSFMDACLDPPHRELFLLNVFLLARKKNIHQDPHVWEKCGQWAEKLIDWEMTDQMAVSLTGEMVACDLSRKKDLLKWVKADHMWKRRLALVSTIASNHSKRSNPELTIAVCEHAMTDKEPMIYKAVGFALREACRGGGSQEVYEFLLSQKDVVYRKTLVESIKKLDPEKQENLLKTG